MKYEFAVSCAFTGHRPSKLPWKYDENHPDCLALKALLAEQIVFLADGGVTRFMTGMAEGVDLWAAQAVLALRERRPELKLDCVLPYKGFEDDWKKTPRKVFAEILDQADSIVYVSREKTENCTLERNRYAVDHSRILLAVYRETRRSGTGMTVRYARSHGREIHIIDPITLAVEVEAENPIMW